MKIFQIPLCECFRCGSQFVPKVDISTSSVIIPDACPKRDCRSKTWNIPDDELYIMQKMFFVKN